MNANGFKEGTSAKLEARVKNTGLALFSAARLILFTLSVMAMLLWTTAAYAQSAKDQYGSPTEPSGPLADALGVLPDTGGPLLLLIAGMLIVGGTGLALLRGRGGR